MGSGEYHLSRSPILSCDLGYAGELCLNEIGPADL
jgi:hypothetical protein